MVDRVFKRVGSDRTAVIMNNTMLATTMARSAAVYITFCCLCMESELTTDGER